MKRPNRAGTVVLDPRIGRYRVRLSKAASGGGKRSWLKEGGKAATFATAEEAERMLSALSLVSGVSGQELSFDAETCRDAFDLELQARDRDTDRRNQKNDWSTFRAWLCHAAWIDWPPAAVQTRHGIEWVEAMTGAETKNARGEKHTVSKARVKAALSLATTLFQRLADKGAIAVNPFRGVKVPGKTRRHTKHFTAREVIALLGCEAIPRIERALLGFFLGTGGRHDEIFLTPLRNLVLDGRDPHWIVEYGARGDSGKMHPPKNEKVRRVPLFGLALECARLYQSLLAQLGWKNESGLAFPSRRVGMVRDRFRHWKTWCELAGIRSDYDSYKLRHTCASLLLSGDMADVIREVLGLAVPRRRWSLSEIGEMFGHGSIEVTARYAHMTESGADRAARETMGDDREALPAPQAATEDDRGDGARVHARANRGPAPDGGRARVVRPMRSDTTMGEAGDLPLALIPTARPLMLLPPASVVNDVVEIKEKAPSPARRRAVDALSTRCLPSTVPAMRGAKNTGKTEPRIGLEPTTAALRSRRASSDSEHLAASGGQHTALVLLALAVLSAHATPAVDEAERARRAAALLAAAAPLLAREGAAMPSHVEKAIAIAKRAVAGKGDRG